MKLLDLFAGIGGFSLAAHWMGWETVAFVEKEPFCQQILRKNFGQNIDIHDDIFNFTGRPFRSHVDIVTGGFPCQPFSAAGKREGVNDERYLFPQSLRIIREVQPAWVVLENVNGLLSMADEVRDVKLASRLTTLDPEVDDYEAIYARTETMLLNRICEAIEGEGYAVQPVVVPAVALGADHERKRVWIVARNSKRSRSPRRAGSDETFKDRDRSDDRLPQSADRDDTNTEKLRRESGLLHVERCKREVFERANTDRSHQDASDANHAGNGASAGEPHAKPPPLGVEREQSQPESFGHGCDAQDAECVGFTELPSEGGTAARRRRVPGSGTDERLSRWTEPWIDAATRLCRVDDGIPDRVHRLKALGNSIVPQIAYEIFRAIDAAEKLNEQY